MQVNFENMLSERQEGQRTTGSTSLFGELSRIGQTREESSRGWGRGWEGHPVGQGCFRAVKMLWNQTQEGLVQHQMCSVPLSYF